MIARNNSFRQFSCICSATLVCVLSISSGSLAQEAQEKQSTERPELPPLTATISPDEALAAIKRRAQKVLEARRAARRMKFYVEASQVVGYETNPSTAANRKGDTFFEEDAYMMLSKKLTPTLSWESSYYGVYLQYLDYGDGDYTSHTFTLSKLRWQPGRVWRVESWLDYDLNYYPTAKDSGYRQLKTASRIRQNLFGTAFHQLQYEFFERDYMTKNARDGGGNETFSNRVDMRHRLRHKAGFTVKDSLPLKNALFTVENDVYRNDSNDARNDYYDYDVWKITSALNGNMTQKLSMSGSFAFERKNYRERPVTGLADPARYDDKYTLASTLAYDFNKTWKMSGGLNFDTLGSNESTGEYDNMKYSVTVTARF